jgi:hypothetical protein
MRLGGSFGPRKVMKFHQYPEHAAKQISAAARRGDQLEERSVAGVNLLAQPSQLAASFSHFLVLAECQFDVLIKLVVVGVPGEFIGGPVAHHKGIQLISFEVGDFLHNTGIKPVIDELVLLFLDQSFLEGQHAPGAGESKHVDDRVQVKPHAQALTRLGNAEARLAKIKYLFVLFAVAQRIHMVVAGSHFDGTEFSIHMQLDIHSADGIKGACRKFNRGFAQIRKGNRIVGIDLHRIMAIGIGERKFS